MLASKIPSLKRLGAIFNGSGVIVRRNRTLPLLTTFIGQPPLKLEAFNLRSEPLVQSWKDVTCFGIPRSQVAPHLFLKIIIKKIVLNNEKS